MDKLISIIVPVYNVEKYLERCVESLVNQTYQDIEIILVDDKSTDSSGELCDELSKSDSRIKVIHKEINEGLGFARNTGIENASGDFFILIDSDDYIDLTTCKTALDYLESNNADICCYMWADVFKNTVQNRRIIESPIVFEGEKLSQEFLANCLAPDESSNDGEYGISACMALYKTELVKNNGVRFVSEREYMNEDMIFRIELCKHIKKAVVIPDNLYYYFHNSGTLTTSYKENRFEESVKMFEKVSELLKYFNCEELYKRNTRYFMINALVSIKQEISHNGYSSYKAVKSICKNKILINAIKSYPISSLPIQQKLFFKLIELRCSNAVFALTKIKLISDKNEIS